MNFDIERLKVLRKEVETYLMFDLIGFADNDILRDDNVIEYEGIKNNVELDLHNQFKKAAETVFKNVNPRHFNLDNIGRDLEMLGHTHWSKRTEDEILRDELLDIGYSFYTYHYKNVEKFKELQQINFERLKAKEEIKSILKDLFKMKFQNSFKENEISKLNIGDNQRRFFESESIKAFEQRDNNTIDRDIYGYINIEDYNRALRDGFSEAKHEAQSEIRNEISDKIKEYLNLKVATQDPPDYYYNLDNELYDFVTELFESRDTEITLKEINLLVDIETYRTWSRIISTEIKSEYQTDDEDDDLDFDDSEYDFDNSKSGYEKYGGYNGYDDGTIDNAFEGDPENTWNVD